MELTTSMDPLDQEIETHLEQAKSRRAKLCELAVIEDEIAVLSQRLMMNKTRKIIREVLQTVATYYDVSPGAVVSKSRMPRVVVARQMTMFILVEKLTLSLSEVGRILKRDHGTVAHGLRAVKNRSDTEPVYKCCAENVSALVEEQIKQQNL